MNNKVFTLQDFFLNLNNEFLNIGDLQVIKEHIIFYENEGIPQEVLNDMEFLLTQIDNIYSLFFNIIIHSEIPMINNNRAH
jgi:hypothetical protein